VALTKLDVLDQCETIKVCTGYRYRGEILTDFPEDETVVGEAEPAYEELEGWGASTRGAKNEADLPAKARRYLERLEELLGVPFCLISTGAQRDETILCEDSPLLRWFPSVRASLLSRWRRRRSSGSSSSFAASAARSTTRSGARSMATIPCRSSSTAASGTAAGAGSIHVGPSGERTSGVPAVRSTRSSACGATRWSAS